MTLRKLTLSVGLLAASLMLAAPAQAETWECAYITQIGQPRAAVFTRKGNVYRYSGLDYQILEENSGIDSSLTYLWFGGSKETSFSRLHRDFCILHKSGPGAGSYKCVLTQETGPCKIRR